jgi:CRISPR-associated endonuclease/helicase Cas3
MSRAANKAARLIEIEMMLLSHPEGLSQAEIARRLAVSRSTINRYLPDLPGHIYIDTEDQSKWKIDRQAYLINVRFDLQEAMAIHLATRLLATRMDRQNPNAASALRKLGIALERLAPQICRHLQQSADAMDDPDRRQDPNYLKVLHNLTRSWAEQRKISVTHESENAKRTEYILSPYFIEPYAIGQSTHVIGWREPPGAIRTFKIDRLVNAELTNEQYQIPNDFRPLDLLADAWGIWFTEDEPVEVVLRFDPRVARRIKETRWHQSETLGEQPDGSLVWKGQIAEPQEMTPWIRGWGGDVEVLTPIELRNAIIRDVAKLAAMYL